MAIRFLVAVRAAVDAMGIHSAEFAAGQVAELSPAVEADILKAGLAIDASAPVDDAEDEGDADAEAPAETTDAAPSEAAVAGPEAAAVAGPSNAAVAAPRRRGRPRKTPEA